MVKFPYTVSICLVVSSGRVVLQQSLPYSPALLTANSSAPFTPSVHFHSIPTSPHFIPLSFQSLRAKPDATYGLLGEVSASLADVHERVPLSDEEPLEILRHFGYIWVG